MADELKRDVTEEQIKQWKAKHGEVFALESDDLHRLLPQAWPGRDGPLCQARCSGTCTGPATTCSCRAGCIPTWTSSTPLPKVARASFSPWPVS